MKNPYTNVSNSRSGFTLVELLIVLVILSILMGLTVGGVNFALKSSKEKKTKVQIEAIKAALEGFHADHLAYPVSTDAEEGSTVLYSALSGDSNFDAEVNNEDIELNWTNSTSYDPSTAPQAKSYLDGLVHTDSSKVWTKEDGNKIYIVDGFENPIQYLATPDTPDQMYNPPNHYDLWSFGIDDQTDTEVKTNQWITNW